MIKAVFDTNVFLSALFWGGKPKQAIQTVLEKKAIGIISTPILQELEEKLLKKFSYPKEQAHKYLALIIENFELVEPKSRLHAVKADPDDNKIIEAAVESKANFIVTGDKHLLNLKQYNKTTILTPNEFTKKTI